MTATADPVAFLDLGAMHAEMVEELDAAWRSVLTTNAFIGGAQVAAFEAAWAAYCGVEHCIGVGNGTDAITLALIGLGIGAGDEVIVPANTFVATAMAVTDAGATPVLVDVDPATLLLDTANVEAALTSRTAAVVVVHLYGQMADMDAMVAAAQAAGIALVEDAAQAHGATWRGRQPGRWGAAATFSFYPGKNLGAFGDGGAIVTDDAELAGRVRLAANHGRSPANRFLHVLDGRNSRLDALQAAVLLAKLRRLDDWNAARRRVHAGYVAELAGVAVRFPVIRSEAASVHHVEAVLVDDPLTVSARLAAEGVETNRHYPIPCHLQPAFAHLATPPRPVAEHAASRQLSLPMHPHLGGAALRRIGALVRAAVEEGGPHG